MLPLHQIALVMFSGVNNHFRKVPACSTLPLKKASIGAIFQVEKKLRSCCVGQDHPGAVTQRAWSNQTQRDECRRTRRHTPLYANRYYAKCIKPTSDVKFFFQLATIGIQKGG